jgi:hypothetical protein
MKKRAERINVQQAAALLGISIARVRVLCGEGRIDGAEKIGRDWLLPSDPKVRPASRQRPGKVQLAPPRRKATGKA